MSKFSIILPVRNGGNYLKECVKSILDQTLQDFDLLVLDNASNDGTLQWLQSITDTRVKIYHSEKSLSIEENWSRITGIPKNEFMTMIGHDDILHRDYLGVMDALIKKHPNASLYQAHFSYINAEGGLIRRCKPMDEVQSPIEFLAFFLSNTIDVMGTGFMMRSKDYDELKGIPAYPNLLFADFELFIGLTAKGYKATATEECFSFRLHQSMTTTSSDTKFHLAFERFISYLDGLKSTNTSYKKIIERYSANFVAQYCQGLAHRLLRTPKNKRNHFEVHSFVTKCKQYADKLSPGNDFDPYAKFNLRLARFIDSNFFTRWLFLLFKRWYSKPIYH